ncbi:MAG: macro domain-containing protein [Anaerolineales bacterium]|nr:macro domain-containing protein [Anaerolineales bacterium]
MNQIIQEHTLPGGARLQFVQGDLTEEQVDAIVNAANAHLAHGGGVAGAISYRGGPQIQAESNAWVRQHGPASHDKPACTGGGMLPCRYVIHAVGPVWGSGDEDAKLAAAVRAALALADHLRLASIALPAISTGIFGFPKRRAADVILAAIQEYFAKNPGASLRQVRLTLFERSMVETFLQAWQALA